MSFKLSFEPVNITELPSEEDILAAAHSILEGFPTEWKTNKTYYGNVKTFSSKGTWHARLSVHPPSEITFDTLWEKLGINKAENEKEFISAIDKAIKIKQISPSQSVWSMFYKFPFPVSPRVFTVLQVTHFDADTRTGMVISIPVIHPESKEEEKRHVRGRYASVERVRELEDGSTEWAMTTESTAGGNIPTLISESSMNSKIAEDVPHLLKWVKKSAST